MVNRFGKYPETERCFVYSRCLQADSDKASCFADIRQSSAGSDIDCRFAHNCCLPADSDKASCFADSRQSSAGSDIDCRFVRSRCLPADSDRQACSVLSDMEN